MRRRAVYVIPVVLAVLAASICIDGGFVFDDREAIEKNPIVLGTAPVLSAFTRDFWGQPMDQGVSTWRPLLPMIWRGLWSVGGGSPLPFRLTSIAFHVLAVVFATRLFRWLTEGDMVAIAVGALFAVHAVETEAVSALVGQADVLSTALGLASLTTFISRTQSKPQTHGGVSAAILLLLACLAKESAFVFGVMAVVWWARTNPVTRRLGVVVPIVFVLAITIGWQLSLDRTARVTTWNNSLVYDAHGVTKLLYGLYLIGRSVALCFIPMGLAPNHGFAAIDLQTATLLPQALLGVLCLVIMVYGAILALRSNRLGIAVAIMLLGAPVLLVSSLFVPIMSDLPERLLYPAALGASAILVLGVGHVLRDRAPVVRGAAAGLAVIVYLALGMVPRRAWRSDDTLWTYAVAMEPRTVRHQYNYSNTLLSIGQNDAAVWHRMVAIYLVNAYPNHVQWDRVEKAEALGSANAWREGPHVLYDGTPCPMVVTLLTQLHEVAPEVERAVLLDYRARYRECVGQAPR